MFPDRPDVPVFRVMLPELVAEAQRHGFVGRGPVETAIEHARGFALVVSRAPGRLLDLGSGGGLPGLVLALHWPSAEVSLLDANRRRCDFLRDAVSRLEVADRVTVVEGRAEEVGRQEDHRGRYDLVTARSFAPPAVTAECAAPFLELGGRLVVSEPPSSGDRWPVEGLASLGLSPDATVTTPYHYRSFVQVSLCPERYPRRVGIPAKRPLF